MNQAKKNYKWKKEASRNVYLLAWILHGEGLNRGIHYRPLWARQNALLYLKRDDEILSAVYYGVGEFESNILELVKTKNSELDGAIENMEEYVRKSLLLQPGSTREDIKILYEEYKENMAIMALSWAMSLNLHSYIRETIPEYEMIASALNIPYKSTFIANENTALIKLSKAQKKSQRSMAERIAKKFGFVHMEYRGKEWSADDYLREAQFVEVAKSSSFRAVPVNLYVDWIVWINRRIVFLYDEAKTALVRANWAILKTLDALGENKLRIMNMTQSEFYNWISTGEKISVYEATVRDKHHLLIYRNQHAELFLEKNKIEERLRAEGIEDLEIKDSNMITGVVASKGIVRGTVRIVFTHVDAEKVEDGDILVASMTTPELIEGMRRAVAFVTDEGGLTCHAAIVSRELKKPCVIGTKIATKVLKDGDFVEVNANKGVVKILEKHSKK